MLLLLSWACVGLGRIMWFFIPICLLAASVLSFIWRNKTVVAVLLLNPMAIAFYQGASEWFDERPAFTGNGLPSNRASNLNRDTRCYRRIGGCVVYGSEWVYHDSHNAGLKLMTILFGQPPKTYHGPYPTYEEATNATASAAIIPLTQFETGEFTVDGHTLHIDPKNINLLVWDLGNNLLEVPNVRAVIWQNECLVIHLQTINQSQTNPKTADGVYLFEINGLKPFARYVDGNSHSPRIPQLLTSLPSK